jgi:hypothetical protein
VRPDPRASLADGVLIQGSVRGWVFGMPILKIRTTLMLSPARIDGAPAPSRLQPAPTLLPPASPAVPGGRRLADAVRAIGEAAERLDDTRNRDG